MKKLESEKLSDSHKTILRESGCLKAHALTFMHIISKNKIINTLFVNTCVFGSSYASSTVLCSMLIESLTQIMYGITEVRIAEI